MAHYDSFRCGGLHSRQEENLRVQFSPLTNMKYDFNQPLVSGIVFCCLLHISLVLPLWQALRADPSVLDLYSTCVTYSRIDFLASLWQLFWERLSNRFLSRFVRELAPILLWMRPGADRRYRPIPQAMPEKYFAPIFLFFFFFCFFVFVLFFCLFVWFLEGEGVCVFWWCFCSFLLISVTQTDPVFYVCMSHGMVRYVCWIRV